VASGFDFLLLLKIFSRNRDSTEMCVASETRTSDNYGTEVHVAIVTQSRVLIDMRPTRTSQIKMGLKVGVSRVSRIGAIRINSQASRG
jgi:hypothetical protein